MKECIVCQDTSSPYTLSKATSGSLKRFCAAIAARNDCFLSDVDFEQDIFWHCPCYAGYVSKHNLALVRKRMSDTFTSELHGNKELSVKNETCVDKNKPPTHVSRSTFASLKWSNCIICGKRSHKHVYKLFSISTEDTCRTLNQAAELKQDQNSHRYSH